MRFGGYWNEAERQAKGLDIIKASIKAGPALKASVVMHDTKPYVCTNMDIFAFVSASVRDDIGIVALIKKGMPGLKTSYVLLQNDSKNPFRFSRHYEDGERIISGECTYDSQHPDITFKPTQAPTSNPIITLPPTPTEKPTATPSSEPISDDNWDTNPDTSGEFTYTVSGDEATITRYTGFRTNVMIPTSIDGYKVVAIRGSAFKDNTTLTDVTIPGTVTAIGYAGADEYPNDYEEGVFKGCVRLEKVTVKAGKENAYIGNRSFKGCVSLKGISIPGNYTNIYAHAFDGCTALASVSWAKTVAVKPNHVIGAYAFSGNTVLETVELNSVTAIGTGAFYGNESLVNVTLNEGVKTIGGSAFENCTYLTEVTIPGTVTVIGYAGADEYPNDYEEGVFKGCKRLQTVNFKGGLADLATCIGNRTFYGCSALKKIYFYKDVPQFISNCFYGVTADVYYPSGNSSWTVDVRQDYGGTITWNSWNS